MFGAAVFVGQDACQRGNGAITGRSVLPHSPNGVAVKRGIGAYQREVFRETLGGQQPVERIAVVKRQGCDLCHVADAEREQGEPVPFHLFRDQKVKGPFEGERTKADLDGHFPKARGADPFGVFPILNKASCLRTEPWTSIYEPQEGMGVQKQIHSI